MNLYYMRDNHTFKKLSMDVDIAIEQIKKEFKDGYTMGMLCTHDATIQPIHASADLVSFIQKIKQWYEQVNTMNIGGNI